MTFDVGKIKAICFDVDGTLSDTDDLWVSRLSTVLSPLSIVFPKRQPAPFARRLIMASESPANAVYHLLDSLNLDDDVARLANFISRHNIGKNPANFWLISDVKDCLQRLNQNFPLAVVSARGSSTFRFLDQYELTPLFKAVAISDTCQYTKPYPDPILWAAQKMGVSGPDCLMVGDTCVDIRAGRAAGAQTVGVLCGFGNENELRRAGADLILPSTARLADHLLG